MLCNSNYEEVNTDRIFHETVLNAYCHVLHIDGPNMAQSGPNYSKYIYKDQSVLLLEGNLDLSV